MRIILEVCPRVTREGGADRLPGISLLPPTTSAHVAIIMWGYDYDHLVIVIINIYVNPIWWSFNIYIMVCSHYPDHQDMWVLMECLSPSSPAAWPTFAPNMTFATQLPLKKRQKKNRTLTKHSFNWAGIRMHMHRNLFNSKQVWITGLPVKRSVSYRVCHF